MAGVFEEHSKIAPQRSLRAYAYDGEDWEFLATDGVTQMVLVLTDAQVARIHRSMGIRLSIRAKQKAGTS